MDMIKKAQMLHEPFGREVLLDNDLMAWCDASPDVLPLAEEVQFLRDALIRAESREVDLD